MIALGLLSAQLPRVAAQERGSGSTPEDSLRALEGMRTQALLRADTVTLSRMVAVEFLEVSRLGRLRTRADNIRDIASGALKLTSVKYDSQAVRIYGDVAMLAGLADNAGTFMGMPFSGRVRYTRRFIRRDGRWPGRVDAANARSVTFARERTRLGGAVRRVILGDSRTGR